MAWWRVALGAVFGVMTLAWFCPAFAISAADYAVRVSATVQTNPPQISLSWPDNSAAVYCSVYRKLRDETSWGSPAVLAARATNYVDTNVVVGGAYEYMVYRTIDGAEYDSTGFIYAGVAVPLVESRGKVILLVDNTFTLSLSNELAQLMEDLVGDGWGVLRHDVSRMSVAPANTSSNVWAARASEIANIKTLIQSDYNADPANVKSLFIFGRVPVPYSGDLAPDGHPNHEGAWPADTFYGDMDGNWTDSLLTVTSGGDSRNRNVPGDGKFDQSGIASPLELQVGRVDFANMSAFSKTETELQRQYLNKDHAFRHQIITAARRGLIDDHFGLSTGEPFAANGWRDFAAFFGAADTFTGDWLPTLSTQSYLWGYGCGGGSSTSCSGVASTTALTTNDPQVVFTMLFGSYFGDWDSQNNFLRAALCTPSYTLTSAWVGRPFWFFHHMGLGETIGFSTRLTQNDDGSVYFGGSFQGCADTALMGDPTLRMHVVGPPSALSVTANGSGGANLAWCASGDTVIGYHIYRASTAAGPFTRLNRQLVNGTNYVDSAVTSNVVYMVRAVKLEVSGSGSYYNASQGIFQSFSPATALPVLTITAQSTNKVFGAPIPEFSLVYSGFVNGDTPASLACMPVVCTTATATSAAGSYPIQASGAVSTDYTILYIDGTLTVSPAVTAGQLSSSANPALPGEGVVFTLALSVMAPGAGIPTGSVQFKVDGTNAGTAVTLSDGTAFSTFTLPHGAHSVTAEYAGDNDFIGLTNELSPQVINSPPMCQTDRVWRDPYDSVKISIPALLSNDTDADGDTLNLVSVGTTSVNGGTVVSNGDWLVYSPPDGFTNSDSFTYTFSDGWSLPVTGSVNIDIRTDLGLSPNLTLTDLGDGSFAVRGDGIPGRSYHIQFSTVPQSGSWQNLGSVTADTNGIFVYIDANVSSQRYYRSVYP